MPRLHAGRRLSVSAYGRYLECARAFSYQYLERLPRPETTVPEHWRRGSAVHRALEVAYLAFKEAELVGSLAQVRPQALAGLRQSWVELELPERGGELDRCIDMVSNTLETLVESHENILGVEQRFLGQTPGGTYFVGYADLVRRWDHETIEVRDYKVRAKVSEPSELVADLQGCMYVHFAREQHPWARKARFSHLYPNHGRLVVVELEEVVIEEALDRFDSVAELIEADEEMAPRPGEHCGWCAYSDVCPAFERAREERDLRAMMDF